MVDVDNYFNIHDVVVGCNYHTAWQRFPGMRFKLIDIKDGVAELLVVKKGRSFKTNASELLFILSGHNIQKAKNILKYDPYAKSIFITARKKELEELNDGV